MKHILILISFVFLTSFGHSQDFNGLWKVIGNVWDGTTERYDNLYFNVRTDSVDFIQSDSIIGKGKIINDTIFNVSGIELDIIDWIRKVNTDSLISSPSNSRHLDNISFKRIDLTGVWEQLSYHWEGRVSRDTCEIIQEKDSLYFFKSSDRFATAYLKMDTIYVVNGFDGVGVDYFVMYTDDSFVCIEPLVEALTQFGFKRVEQNTSIDNILNVYDIQIYPNPADNYIRIETKDKLLKIINLYSMTGERLKFLTIENLSVDLNISDLLNGIYILEIEFDNDKIIRQKILKE